MQPTPPAPSSSSGPPAPSSSSYPGIAVPARRHWWLGGAGVVLVLVLGAGGFVGALGAEPTAQPGQHRPSGVAALAPVAGAFAREAAPAPAAPAHGLPGSAANQLAATGAGQNASSAAAAGEPARIEETGSITLVVRGSSIQADTAQLMALATASGGFVASTGAQSATPGSPAQGTVTLQVPVHNFNALLAQVRSLGKVSLLTTSAVDVTGQYVDLQARINALEESRRQYLTIMAKATTVGGILAVQEQLDSLQGQLEQLQGQMRLLDNETTYATLTVTLTEKAAVAPAPRPEPGLTKAWNAAVGGFVAGFEGMVRVAGPLLFAVLLLAVLLLVARGAWKARQRHAG